MMLRKYLELEVLFFILVGAAVGYVLLLHQQSTTSPTLIQGIQETAPIAVSNPSPTLTPMPTPTNAPTPTNVPSPKPSIVFNQAVTSISQDSSDGTKTVTVTSSANTNGNQTYSVSVNNGPIIFSKTLTPGNSISIPYNTWSPDNTYFFLQENSGSQTQVMVFNGSGQPFSNGGAYLDLTGVFAQDVSSPAFSKATGWASDNLIIIETKNSDGSEGTSYWFGVPDESVTPLATLF